MKRTVAAVVTCLAAVSFALPAMADSVVVKVKPAPHVVGKVVVHPRPVVRRTVVVKPACHVKTVRIVSNHKTVIRKTRVCR